MILAIFYCITGGKIKHFFLIFVYVNGKIWEKIIIFTENMLY